MNRLFLAATLTATALVTVTAFTLTAQPQMPPPPDAQPQGATQPQGSPQDDPPSRVARLNWVSGDVAFQPATVDTWTNATLNYPLTTGDHLFVNPGGRAELHIEGSAIRLNANSNFGFLNLNDSIVQMSLNQGSLAMRLRQLDQNDTVEIDTPNGAVTLLRAGEYRVDTDPVSNATTVTVRDGQAQMYQDGNSLLITPHQTVAFSQGAGPAINPEARPDEFDGFVGSRNNAEDALPRRQYVPETMVGYQDLYAYGHWVNDPMYGQVWVPPVTAGWSPYSTGRWAFVQPWGWTWVDEAPWGFAPFHYGRWARVSVGWVWIPGAPSYRPVYAPALVGFTGFGVSVGIGWFPLGPREPWIPAWGASRAYINNVNVMHVTNVNVINVTNVTYVNRSSVTVVSQADFAGARPVAAVAVRVSPAQIQGAQVLGANPAIVPARASIVVGASRPAPAISARVVVARTPPPPAPVSFESQQQALAQNRGVPLRAAQVAQIRAQQPAAVVARPAVRAIGAVPAQPAAIAPANRMNSVPPGVRPATTPAPPAQTRPMQPAVTTPPAQTAPTAPRPAATPAPAQVQPAPAPASPAGRPAPAKQTSKGRGKPAEKDEKKP